MLISENWLREWVNPNMDTATLAETLTMAGLEVNGVEKQSPQFSNVVVAEVLAVDPHPESGKLKLCQVSFGCGSPVSVVCGADNAVTGMKVPLARIGARLADGRQVVKSRIHGMVSSGMLCSRAELGLSEASDGIYRLDDAAVPGTSLAKHLQLDDHIIELELTPNRGDCLSIAGVAREVAALTCAPLHRLDIKPVRAATGSDVPIRIEAGKGCPRYVGRVVENIDPGVCTPDRIAERLRRSGIRPVSVIVDITNYVMLELGQPMHAFDLDNIQGGIIVRNAKSGEKLTLLDESKLDLESNDLLICDHKGPVALAGIMGGLGSGISNRTCSVLLESAYFAQAEIIGKARRIGMQTDASYRFERGVDPYLQRQAMERATRLLEDICGGRPGPVLEAQDSGQLPEKLPVTVRSERVRRLLGAEIDSDRIEDYLVRLGCKVSRSKTCVIATPPANRFDLEKEHDLIEEVARLYGYNRIPGNPPFVKAGLSGHSEASVPAQRIRAHLVDRGMNETITYSFVDPALQDKFHPSTKGIRLANPISSNLGVMRLSLIPGLLQGMAGNYHRQHRQIRLFETGNIFFVEKKQRQELSCLGVILTGLSLPEQWGAKTRMLDFYDMKAEIESLAQLCRARSRPVFRPASEPGFHPGRCAKVYTGNRLLGIAGQILPSICQQLDVSQDVYFFQLKLPVLESGTLPQYRAISRFPSIRRDLSFVIDAAEPAGNLVKAIHASAGRNLVDLNLFDVYTGEPIDSTKKSVSFGLTFQALDRTLTETELDTICESIIRNLADKFDAQLRQ